MKRSLSFVILVVALVGVSCRQSSDSVTTLKFWALGVEGENVKAFIPEFERRNPTIKVRVQQIPWTAAHEKLLTSYAGNSSPDICQLGNTWVPEFSMLNALEDLTPWIEKSSVIKTTDYFPGILETNFIDSSLYGIPWYVDTRVLFFRKDILAQAGFPDGPKTWNDLVLASQRITGQTKQEGKYAMLFPTNEWPPPVIFGLQAGSRLLKDNDTRGYFSSPEFTRAFEYYISFFKKKFAPVGITQVTNIYQGFTEGMFAMYITGPWNIGEFLSRLPDYMQDKWMTAPLPSPDSSYPGVSLAGGSSLVMFRSSEHKTAAWKFIEYLSEKEQQLKFYRNTGNLPAITQAWNNTVLSKNVYVAAFHHQLQNVTPTPKIPEWEQIAMKVQEYAEVASTGKLSVSQALASLDEEVNKILEKRRWLLEKKKVAHGQTR